MTMVKYELNSTLAVFR